MINDDGLEEATSGDWMESLLRSPIFQNLPPVYLQQILINLLMLRTLMIFPLKVMTDRIIN
jgi:hypothetical protein